MQISSYRLLFFLLFTLVLTGCGYHTPYSKDVDGNQERISVYLSVWKNNTNELGFEGKILQKIADWLQESKHITLTPNRNQADLILSGSIDSIEYPATAFSDSNRATTLKALVKTSYQLIGRESEEKVKLTQNTVREASYSVGSDAVWTQSFKRDALSGIADAVGEQIYLEVFYAVTGMQK